MKYIRYVQDHLYNIYVSINVYIEITCSVNIFWVNICGTFLYFEIWIVYSMFVLLNTMVYTINNS